MAMTARELVFFIRAENQASGVFRKVARDLRGLSSAGVIDIGQKYAKQTEQMVKQGNALANSSKLNLTNGTKNLALRKAELDAQIKQVAVAKQYNSTQQAIRRNSEALTRARVQEQKLGQLVQWRNPLPGHTLQQTFDLHQASISNVETLTRQEQLLGNNLDEVRLKASAASIALDQEAASAKVARINAISAAFSHLARYAQIAGVIGVATLGALAVSAAKFNTQTTLAATQARPVGAPISATAGIQTNINKVILNQMKQFPAASKDMADSFYQIFSGTNVQNVGKAAQMLRVFNQMAVAGGSDLKTMTDAGISLYNNFPGEFKNMTDAANHFFAAVRYARTTPAQFANSLSNVLPVAKAAGRTFKDVADAMALITRQSGGRLTSRDSTGLARLMEMFSRADVIKGLRTFGIEAKESSGKLKPILTLIDEINNKFVKTGKLKPGPDTLNFFKMVSAAGSKTGTGGTMGTIQGRRVFDYLLTNLPAYHKVAAEVNNDQNEFTRSYAAMAKSPGVKWAVLVNQLKALAIVIGQDAIPAFIKLGEPIIKVLNWFNHLSDGTKNLMAKIAVFGSVGAIFAGTIIRIGAAFTTLATGLGFFTGTRGVGKVASEAGSARLGVLGLLGVLGTFAVILAKDPHLITQVTHALGGTRNAIKLLSIAITTFSIASLIKRLTIIGATAGTAATEVGILTRSLIALRLLGPIAVVVTVFMYRKQIGDAVATGSNKVENLLNKIPGVNLSPSLTDAQFQALTSAKKTVAKAEALGIKVPMPDIKLHGSVSDKAKEIIAYAKAVQKKAQAAINRMPKQPIPAGEIAPKMRDPALTKAANTQADKVAKAAAIVKNQTFMQELQNVGRLQQAYAKSHSLKDEIAFYNANAKLQKDFTDKAYQAYAGDYLSRISQADTKATKDAVSNAKKKVNEMKAVWTQAAQTLQQTFSTLQQNNATSFGTIFQGPYSQSPRVQNEMAWGGKMTGKDLLHDLKSQVAQFRHWRTALGKLHKAGIPFELLQQIEAAGPSALPQVQALLGLSKRDLRTYFRTFTRGQNIIEVATKTDMSRQLAHYRTFGSKIALAIIQGLRDEKVPMLSYFEKLIKDMFPGLVKAAKGAPKDITKGTLHSGPPKVKKPPAPRKPTTGRRSPVIETTAYNPGSGGGNTFIENNYITTTADPKDVKGQLAQAAFKKRAHGLLV